MWAWVVVVPFTPDVTDVGDLALLVLLVTVAGAVGGPSHAGGAASRPWNRRSRARIATLPASNRGRVQRPAREVHSQVRRGTPRTERENGLAPARSRNPARPDR